ncbi:MAG: hypothetical protein ACTSVB_06675, partial [Candidatus Heimdallarchaeaceae archaeon]
MDRNKIDTAVEQVKETFQSYPDIFLTESDMKCHLFAKLLEDNNFSKIKKTKDNSNSINLHSEVRWYGNEDKKLKYRSDIVIIDASDLKTKNSTVFRLPSKGYGFNIFFSIIEVKLRRNGVSDKPFLKNVKKDVEKLQEISKNVSSNFIGYLVIFDKKKDIIKEISNI